jgi:hypothetical protein
MKRLLIPNSDRADGMSSMWTYASRIALLLAAVTLLVMPLTEYLWHFDKFLQGGQDFELGLLCFATVLCLVMLLVQQRKCSLRLAFALFRWLSMVFRRADRLVRGSFRGLITAMHGVAVPSPSLSDLNLPLQI